MPLLPAALLIVALAAVAWFTWRDVGEYAAFKKLTDTRDRQARYRRWVLNAFVLFVGGSLAILAILGDLGCVIHQPKPFFGAFRWAQALAPADPEFLGALVAGFVVAIVASTVLFTVVARRGGLEKAPVLGDVAPLMPRNGAETVWTALLSINAGIGEELFFRLTLPLLIVLVFGHAPAAFVAAALVFGLAHVYQGWIGVLATTVVGFVFTGVYLWSGSLLAPMALHAGLDLLSLVVRPTLLRAAQRR
ncbi:MAG TPA: CPBP family intramembrane glutamic endopeptidase [Caulobacteraceae bacterium]|jgi:membrane protease YdiL (CAAX protease family)|nr:CPBP family intramembrane glutamic endopeptidase [Caulobacteraceae bacterium]